MSNQSKPVVWTERERVVVARGVMASKEANPSIPFTRAINIAMASLPEYRRRKIVAIESTPWLNDLIAELKRQDGLDKLPVACNVMPGTNPVENLGVKLEEANLKIEKLEAALKQQTTSSSDSLLDKLADRLADRIANSLATRLDRIEEILTGLVNANHIPKEKVILKRVGIIGLQPIQISEVKEKFKGMLDLRFFGTDQSLRLIKESAPYWDQGFVVVGKSSHEHQRAATRNTKPGVRVDLVKGCTSSLIKALEEYYMST